MSAFDKGTREGNTDPAARLCGSRESDLILSSHVIRTRRPGMKGTVDVFLLKVSDPTMSTHHSGNGLSTGGCVESSNCEGPIVELVLIPNDGEA
jgi:hypothetical protein